MNLKDTSMALKWTIPLGNNNALDIPPDEVTTILEISCHALCEYIKYSNEQLGNKSEAYISPREISRIESVFTELINNFFPMAHSTSPLRDLQIVNKPELLDIKRHLESMENFSNVANEISKQLSDSIQRLINP